MNIIKEAILKVQKHLLKQDSLVAFFYISIFYFIFFFLYIQLESIFYFSPETKISVFHFFLISFFSLCLIYGIQYYRAIKGEIKRYNIKQISKSLGQKLYPHKKDKILNAFQIESNIEKSESEDLAKSFIKSISNDLSDLNFFSVFKNKRLITAKQIFLTFLILIILVFSIRYENSKYAFNRLIETKSEFFAPKPFSLINLTKSIHILGGEVAKISVYAENASPDTVVLKLNPTQKSIWPRDSLKLEYFSIADSNGNYNFNLPKLFQDYSYEAVVNAHYFWQAWGHVSSGLDTIFVTDRPSFENFQIIITPPSYSKLPKRKQEGNLSVVEVLKGSRVNINLTSNRTLESANILVAEENLKMKVENKKASGYFDVLEENIFSVNLFDKRGITNRDPIQYKVQVIPDQFPELYVNQPKKDLEIGTDQVIIINLELQDDFGFNNLQLAYEVHRPDYLKAEPFVSMKQIDDLDKDILIQEIQTFWDIEELGLMPQDEVHFHFELTDNDNISGPKKTISKKIIARVPSLADLYANTEISENSFIEDIKNELEEINELKEDWEKLELEMIKSSELSWEQKQSIKSKLEEVKTKLKNLEEISKSIDSVTEQAEKHDLFSSDLLEKFKELSELIRQIMPKDLLSNMDELNKALENMNMETLNDALNNLSENMEKMKDDLDRYLEVFKRLQAEQKMDELKNRIEKLLKKQDALSEDINQLNEDTKSSTDRLAQEEKRILEELNNIKSLITETTEATEPFSQKTSDRLKELNESPVTEGSKSTINETMKNLSNQNMSKAQKMSEESMEYLQKMNQTIMDIHDGFQKETVDDMSKKFQVLMQDMLYLSSQEESLKSDVSSSSRNSPKLREFAYRQQLLQDQLQSITSKMIELSKETFSITPKMGRSIGKANSGMQTAKKTLTERNINKAKVAQEKAMVGLNESVLELFQSIQKMKSSGSSSGYDQFLQMMEEMAQKQKGLNKRGMQLGLGQMNPSMQGQLMKDLLQEQQGIRKSLEKLMNEMKNSGNQNNQGSLEGIKNEMDKVLNDLNNKNFNPKTKERQKRILSRMLDSQAAMTERGYKDERKSKTVKSYIKVNGIGGLPENLGQRKNLTLEALNNAVKAGYKKEHQIMIKRYFNSLNQAQSINNSENIKND